MHEEGDEFLGLGLFFFGGAFEFEFVFGGFDEWSLAELHDDPRVSAVISINHAHNTSGQPWTLAVQG